MPVVEIWCVQYQVLVPAASWAGHHSWAHLVASQLLLTHNWPHFEWGILSFLDAGFWMQAIVSRFIVSSEYMLYFKVLSHTKHLPIDYLSQDRVKRIPPVWKHPKWRGVLENLPQLIQMSRHMLLRLSHAHHWCHQFVFRNRQRGTSKRLSTFNLLRFSSGVM